MKEIPQAVIELAEKRKAAKEAKDYSLSDSLREEIAALGWLIKDVPAGYEITEKPPFNQLGHLNDLANLDDFVAATATVGLLADGWAEDLKICAEGILNNTDANLVILDLANIDGAGLAAEEISKKYLGRVTAIHLSQELNQAGWANCQNALICKVTSPVYLAMDLSTVAAGDFLNPLLEKINQGFSAVGWKGALVDLTDNWRSVVDKGTGEVDVLMSYLFAIKTDIAKGIGPDQKAKFYRNADMEWSLMLRAAGHRLYAIDDLPVSQGRHHGYHDSEPNYRDQQSKKTYERLLQKFRGKNSILSPRR